MPRADAYVITIPPSGITGYAGKVAALIEAIDAAARPVVFCSSTSVYPDEARTMVESDVLPGEAPAAGEADAAPHGTPRGELLAAEGACARHPGHVILRLGGLYGAGRHPVTFLSGRTGVPRPLAVVNMVHLDDVVAAVVAILDRGVAGEVFNVCPIGIRRGRLLRRRRGGGVPTRCSTPPTPRAASGGLGQEIRRLGSVSPADCHGCRERGSPFSFSPPTPPRRRLSSAIVPCASGWLGQRRRRSKR